MSTEAEKQRLEGMGWMEKKRRGDGAVLEMVGARNLRMLDVWVSSHVSRYRPI